MNKSLSKRILYSFMCITTLVLFGVSLGLSFIIKDYFWENREKELISDGLEVVKNITEIKKTSDDKTALNEYLQSVDHFLRARIWVIDQDRRLAASSRPFKPRVQHEEGHKPEHRERERPSLRANSQMQLMLDNVYKGEIQTIRTLHPYFDEYVIVVGLPIRDAGGNIAGALLLNTPVRGLEVFLVNIYYYITAVGVFAVILSWWLSKLLSRRIVQPLVLMKENAAAMAKGDYTHKVDIKGQDEIAELGVSLNSLAGDLEEFVEQTERMEQLRRDFVANVSHELRTPITIIRGYNEAMLDGTITQPEKITHYQNMIREETIRLENLIRELLDISRLQARVERDWEEIPLDVIVGEVADKLLVKAEEKNIKITVAAEPGCFVHGMGDRLVQLVMILADNAVKYSLPGGNVWLSIEKNTDGEVVLAVSDDGVGIAQEEQPRVWDRFYKVDKSHAKSGGGSGLGLAIAKEIIDIHKARLHMESAVGQGTKIEITFPAQP